MWALLACSHDPGPRPGHPDGGDPRHVDLQPVLDEAILAHDGYGGGIASVHSPGEGALDLVVSGDAFRGGPPMALDSTFEVASVTKTFTATAVLLLDQQGALSIDQPAGDFVPDLMAGFDYGSRITIRQLLNQTSGLPDYWNDPPFVHGHQNAFLVAFIARPNRVWHPDELVAYAADLTPFGEPGTIWHYADTNYVILGRILEVVRGQALQDVYRDLLFDPLGLGTMYLTYHEDAPTDRVEAHRYEGHDDLYQVPRQSADWAGGGLVSSTDDLSTFIEALATGKVLDDAHLGEMTTWVDTEYGPDEKYGMGLFWYDLGPAGQIWGHDGYGNAWMYWWPEQKLSLTGSLDQTYDYDTWLPVVEDAFAQIAPQ